MKKKVFIVVLVISPFVLSSCFNNNDIKKEENNITKNSQIQVQEDKTMGTITTSKEVIKNLKDQSSLRQKAIKDNISIKKQERKRQETINAIVSKTQIKEWNTLKNKAKWTNEDLFTANNLLGSKLLKELTKKEIKVTLNSRINRIQKDLILKINKQTILTKVESNKLLAKIEESKTKKILEKIQTIQSIGNLLTSLNPTAVKLPKGVPSRGEMTKLIQQNIKKQQKSIGEITTIIKSFRLKDPTIIDNLNVKPIDLSTIKGDLKIGKGQKGIFEYKLNTYLKSKKEEYYNQVQQEMKTGMYISFDDYNKIAKGRVNSKKSLVDFGGSMAYITTNYYTFSGKKIQMEGISILKSYEPYLKEDGISGFYVVKNKGSDYYTLAPSIGQYLNNSAMSFIAKENLDLAIGMYDYYKSKEINNLFIQNAIRGLGIGFIVPGNIIKEPKTPFSYIKKSLSNNK